jgi:hypothetical protein
LRALGLANRAEDLGQFALDLVARKVESYALNKVEEVFFFSRYSSLTVDGLIAFLTVGVALAQAARLLPGKPMGVFCVALVDDPDDLAIEEAEWGSVTASARTDAMPVPVILDLRYGQIHFLQQVPIFSSSYLINLLRDLIHKYLLPGAALAGTTP